MSAKLLCPDSNRLERYLLGQLADDDSNYIDEHLAACEDCCATADSLRVDDTIIEAIRAYQADRLPGEAEAVAALSETLSRIPASLPAKTECDVAMPDARRALALQMLEPRGKADEIGRLGTGRYRVLRLLGTGGMGAVFEAEDQRLGRRVAVKVMTTRDSNCQARFLREARAVASLEHEHIMPIYEVSDDTEIPYFTMPLLDGETLKQRIVRDGGMSVGETARIGSEIAAALGAAHRQGLFHRDVKPENIWLENGVGRVKLFDFGLARSVDTADGEQLTEAPGLVGTPAYMAPEQLTGSAVDQRSDLFSLGCVLYYMASGRLPFQGATRKEILFVRTHSQPMGLRQLNPSVPEPLSRLVMSLLRRSPDDRPPTAESVEHALRQIQTAPTPARPSRTGRWTIAALCTATSLIVAGIIYFNTGRGTVILAVNEADVEVSIDGVVQQIDVKSPRDQITIQVPAGRHTMEVSRDGMQTVTSDFRVFRHGREEIVASFESVGSQREKPSEATGTDPYSAEYQRAVAEWVLRRPGFDVSVSLSGLGEVRRIGDLPTGPFRIHVIKLASAKLRDEDIAMALRLPDMQGLSLTSNKLTNKSIAALVGQQSMQWLYLSDNPITDDCTETISKMVKLESLSLSTTRVTDPGVERLVTLTNLKTLHLCEIELTDTGLESIAKISGLEKLKLASTAITDDGLRHLTGLSNLEELDLGENPQLTDAALSHLSQIGSLNTLRLSGTGLTPAGIEELSQALPDCGIIHSFPR